MAGSLAQEHTARACLCGPWWPGCTQGPGGVWCDEDTSLSWSAGPMAFSPGVSSSRTGDCASSQKAMLSARRRGGHPEEVTSEQKPECGERECPEAAGQSSVYLGKWPQTSEARGEQRTVAVADVEKDRKQGSLGRNVSCQNLRPEVCNQAVRRVACVLQLRAPGVPLCSPPALSSTFPPASLSGRTTPFNLDPV